MQQKDVIGEKYNKLTITGLSESIREPSGRLVKRVSVICDCGNTKDSVGYRDIKRGKTKSCGCLSIPKTIVNIGDKYNLWTVYDDKLYNIGGNSHIKVRCICGKEKIVILQSLKSGKSKSCGCQGKIKIVKEKTLIPTDTDDEKWKNYNEHILVSNWGNFFNVKTRNYFGGKDKKEVKIGESKQVITQLILKIFYPQYKDSYVRILNIPITENNLIVQNKKDRKTLSVKYACMKVRCYNPSNRDYKNYGARGITICDEWLQDKEKFIVWGLGQGFKQESKLEIDRTDNNLGYSPENCKFVTRQVNNRNTRRIIFNQEIVNDIRYGTHKDKTTTDLAVMFNCSRDTIKNIKRFKTWNF